MRTPGFNVGATVVASVHAVRPFSKLSRTALETSRVRMHLVAALENAVVQPQSDTHTTAHASTALRLIICTACHRHAKGIVAPIALPVAPRSRAITAILAALRRVIRAAADVKLSVAGCAADGAVQRAARLECQFACYTTEHTTVAHLRTMSGDRRRSAD